MQFSVVIPCYNAYAYIRTCLDSLMCQIEYIDKIIFVNDGSTDDTQFLLDELKELNHKIVVVSQKNMGLSVARNTGTQYVESEYFVFLDSDDYLVPNFFSTVLQYSDGQDLLTFNINYVDQNNSRLSTTAKHSFTLDGENALVTLIKEKQLFVAACEFVYKTSFYKQHNFLFAVGKKHEDYGLVPIIILNANQVISIESALYNYVQTSNSLVRGVNQEQLNQLATDLFDQSVLMINQVKAHPFKDDTHQKVVLSFIANSVLAYCNQLENDYLKNYKAMIKKHHIVHYLNASTIKEKTKKQLLKINLYFVRWVVR